MNTERGTNIKNETVPSGSGGVQRSSNHQQASGGHRNRTNHGEKSGHGGSRRSNGRNARNNNARQSAGDATSANNGSGVALSSNTSGTPSLSIASKGDSVYHHGSGGGRHHHNNNHHHHYHHHNRSDQHGQTGGFDSRNSHHNNNHQSRLVQPSRALNECLLNDMEEFPSLNDAMPVVPQLSEDSLFGNASSSIYNNTRSTNALSSSTTQSSNVEPLNTTNTLSTSHNNNNPTITLSQNTNASSFHVSSTQQSSSHRQSNNRRGGNSSGNYKNNNVSRGDNQQGVNTYNNKGGGNASYRMSGPNHSSITSSQQTNAPSNQHNSNHFQSGGHPRPRGNRRNNMGGNFDHRRPVSGTSSANAGAAAAATPLPGRDYGHNLPGLMNGLRIGIPPPPPPQSGVQQLPVSYYPSHVPPYQPQHPIYHQPMLTPVPIHHFNSASAAIATSQHKPEIYRGSPLLPGLSFKDLQESEQYKSRTLNSDTNNFDRVRYQVEFYFCNWNLRADTYMRSLMDTDGWVHASQLLSFNRVAKYGFSVEELGKTLQNSTKLEQKHVGTDLFVRRSEDPKKWTEDGLRHQLRTLFMAHPELDPIREMHAGGFIPSNANGAQPHPMAQFAYSLTGMMNAVYDGSIMPNIGFDNSQLHPSYSDSTLVVGPMSLPSFGVIPSANILTQSTGLHPDMASVSSVPPRSSSVSIQSTTTRPQLSSSQQAIFHNDNSTQTQTNSIINNLSNPDVLKDTLLENPQDNEDFSLDQQTYDECLEKVGKVDTQVMDDATSIAAERLCRFWTHTLVLTYDNDQYTRFKTIATCCMSQNNRSCIDMLYKFYTRYINRHPICSSEAGGTGTTHCAVSQKLFEDFQSVAVFDYENNECVHGLHELAKFYNQHFNPSRISVPLNTHVAKLLDSLGLKDFAHNMNPTPVATVPQTSSN